MFMRLGVCVSVRLLVMALFGPKVVKMVGDRVTPLLVVALQRAI